MNDGTQQDPAGSAGDPDDRDDALLAQLAGLRRALAQSVVVTGERVQETVEDAVRRGRMTRRDAQELAAAIVAGSRRQTEEIRQELEALLDRGRRLGRRVDAPSAGDADAGAAADGPTDGGVGRAGGGANPAGGDATAADGLSVPSAAAADAAATTAPLPIPDYDDLTAVLVRKSLAKLSPAELRAVRDHETTHANRKTVVAAVDRLLGDG